MPPSLVSSIPFGSVLLSMNRTWFGFWYSVGYSGLLLALTLLLVPRFAGAGLASALAMSYVIASLVCVLYIYRREKSFVGDVRLSPVIGMVALTTLVCAALDRVFNPVAAALGGGVVVSLFVAFNLRNHTFKRFMITRSGVS